jgi:hypothetical protein
MRSPQERAPVMYRKRSLSPFSKPRLHALAVLCLLLLPFLGSVITLGVQSHAVTATCSLAAELPSVSITYTSRWNSTPTVLSSGNRISGDHVIITASWAPIDNVNGTLLEVVAPAIPQSLTAANTTPTVQIDTRALGNNATCTVNATAWLLNGTRISQVLANVFIGNFFVPHVTVLSPNGGEPWAVIHNVTWDASDPNSDDLLVFDVLVSMDDGTTFMLLASDLNRTWFVWDSTGFYNRTTYVFQVRAFDGIYWASDQSDGPFAAGGVIETTTGTNTTDTSYDNNQMVALFISAAIISSALLSLVVYYIAKKDF